MIKSVIEPKQPKPESDWERAAWWQCPPQLAALGYPVEAWEHPTGLFVLSAVERAKPETDMEDIGPEYHLSISLRGGRCDSKAAKYVLKTFGLEDATEDNHVPHGKVRNFWRPVADKFSGIECKCKEEPAMIEDKGDFVWRGITK